MFSLIPFWHSNECNGSSKTPLNTFHQVSIQSQSIQPRKCTPSEDTVTSANVNFATSMHFDPCTPIRGYIPDPSTLEFPGLCKLNQATTGCSNTTEPSISVKGHVVLGFSISECPSLHMVNQDTTGCADITTITSRSDQNQVRIEAPRPVRCITIINNYYEGDQISGSIHGGNVGDRQNANRIIEDV